MLEILYLAISSLILYTFYVFDGNLLFRYTLGFSNCL